MIEVELKINEFNDKYYYIRGIFIRHRLDGPAIECADGSKFWYLDGKRHREDGPACEFADGAKYWYLDDKIIDCTSQQEFNRIIKLKIFL